MTTIKANELFTEIMKKSDTDFQNGTWTPRTAEQKKADAEKSKALGIVRTPFVSKFKKK